jgi:eukaryotic-like serine/threonine-protein kinase
MELLDGETLGDLIQRKQRLAPTRAVRTLLPIASALAAAHEAGIVHRDLKPDNVILSPDGSGGVVPKLVDFGIAKLRRPGAGDMAITRAGDILGSVDYMSPEQARGTAEVDERTDGWALCVLVYEAITGTRPFRGKNDDAILSAILLDDPAPPSGLGVDDEGLWTILSRGLEKSPEVRWPTVRALGKALARWALERGVEHDVAGTSLAAHWLGKNAVTDKLPPEAQDLAELDHAELVARLKHTPASDAASAQEAGPPEPDPPPPRVPIARAPWAVIAAAMAFVAAVAVALTQC